MNKFIEDDTLIDGYRPEVVRRSWRERLFTRPWRPWIKTKVIEVPIPSASIFKTVEGHYRAHPAIIKELRRATEKVGLKVGE